MVLNYFRFLQTIFPTSKFAKILLIGSVFDLLILNQFDSKAFPQSLADYLLDFFAPLINKISFANITYQETTRIFVVKLSITRESKYRLKVGFWDIPTTIGYLASPA